MDAMWWAVDTLDLVVDKLEAEIDSDPRELRDEALATCDRLHNLKRMIADVANDPVPALEKRQVAS